MRSHSDFLELFTYAFILLFSRLCIMNINDNSQTLLNGDEFHSISSCKAHLNFVELQ